MKPGKTVDVPGGVEKVRIVRDPGEWAAPLKPGEILDVEVKEGDKVIGKMDWYGDKVFFDGLSQGTPLVSTGDVPSGSQKGPALPRNPEPPKEESLTPQPEVESEPTPTPVPAEKSENGGPEIWIFLLSYSYLSCFFVSDDRKLSAA